MRGWNREGASSTRYNSEGDTVFSQFSAAVFREQHRQNVPGWGSSSRGDLGARAPSSAVINETSELSFSTTRNRGKCLWEKKCAGLVTPSLTQRLLLVSDSWDRECPLPRQCHSGWHPSPGTIVLLMPKGICPAGPPQVLAGGGVRSCSHLSGHSNLMSFTAGISPPNPSFSDKSKTHPLKSSNSSSKPLHHSQD